MRRSQATLAIAGEFDWTYQAAACDLLHQARDAGAVDYYLDLGDSSFVGASIIHTALTAYRCAHVLGGRVSIDATPQVRRLLDLAHVTPLVCIRGGHTP